MKHGTVTRQERWEEASGYSPSTLASNIVALIGASEFARSRSDEATASLLEEYADFLESHLLQRKKSRTARRVTAVFGEVAVTIPARLGGKMVYQYRVGVDRTHGAVFPEQFAR